MSLQKMMMVMGDDGPPQGVVEDFAKVVWLSDFDGAQGSTTKVDQSDYAHTYRNNTSFILDQVQKQFGTASLKCANGQKEEMFRTNSEAGGRDGIDIDSDKHFTIEFGVRFPSTPAGTEHALITGAWHSPGNHNWMIRSVSNVLSFAIGNGTAALNWFSAPWVPIGGQWYHVAICIERGDTDVLRMFIDGTQIGTDSTVIDGKGSNSAGSVYMGGDCGSYWNGSGGFFPNGHLDDIRVVKGEALYTRDFDKPTAAHPTS